MSPVMIDLATTSHRRLNLLTGEWVLVSPHRTQRPWQGQTEARVAAPGLAHDPDCYLCAGNTRAGGHVNPAYTSTFVFDNDFQALQADAGAETVDIEGLLRAEGEAGVCRVVCFSPRHDLTLARMSVADIAKVVDVWVEQFFDLGSRDGVRAVQIFENRGQMMGCSNPHPHGQIWATASLPNELLKEQGCQAAYFADKGRPLLADVLDLELRLGERIVYQNAHFVVLVPYWAIWPFETMVLPRRPVSGIDRLTEAERGGLAEALKVLTTLYDNLFQTSFPYSMGFHQRPTDGEAHPEWVFHGHFYPPLLRSATVKKFMVGFEMLGTPQRDLTPEAAADRLRAAIGPHYLDG
jgi:UDPglucose--hexose-1-phosphate uridylyltransferase